MHLLIYLAHQLVAMKKRKSSKCLTCVCLSPVTGAGCDLKLFK